MGMAKWKDLAKIVIGVAILAIALSPFLPSP
jgi:hypothetical protein